MTKVTEEGRERWGGRGGEGSPRWWGVGGHLGNRGIGFMWVHKEVTLLQRVPWIPKALGGGDGTCLACSRHHKEAVCPEQSKG